jgi:hypothetical protein
MKDTLTDWQIALETSGVDVDTAAHTIELQLWRAKRERWSLVDTEAAIRSFAKSRT